MPKKGIHPVLHTMTYVMKNGASRQILTTKKPVLPYLLQQDTTTHPYWTGKTSTLEEGQEGSLARAFTTKPSICCSVNPSPGADYLMYWLYNQNVAS
ncbi:hypothetical protein WJX84_003588 [Apatococcus fuscideae]|uniref:Large ribosomal subunit protein bL31c n=1 Tax=Apatococcus fuscideae TaxID=2026836 RepID=A0AAW1SQS2_9CHLO